MWQQKDLPRRLRDVSGPQVAFDYDNAIAPNVTLDYKINMAPLTDDVKLKDLMDIKGDYLCYTYE
jgi:tyrosinase